MAVWTEPKLDETLDLVISRIIEAPLAGFRPAAEPFDTAIVTMQGHAGGTKYTAYALHGTAANCETHEKMGFHEGWGNAIGQLAAVVARLQTNGP